MRRQVLGVLGGLVLCTGSWWAGRASVAPEPAPAEVAPEVPEWRVELRAALSTADASSARARALIVLDTADGEAGLVRATRLLASVATPADLPLLHSLARSADPRLELAAVDALSLMDHPDARALLVDLSREPRTRHAALTALGASAHPDALRLLGVALLDPSSQDAAADGLVALGTDDAAALLIERFQGTDVWESPTWADRLARMPADAPSARAFLRRVVKGGRAERREAAMVALAAHKDPAIHGLLVGRALSGDVGAVRALAAQDDTRAIEVLSGLIGGGGPVAVAVVDALPGMSHPDATTLLRDVVRDGVPSLASAAIWGLSDLEDPRTIDVLLAAIDDRPEVVRSAALSRLMGHPWQDPPAEVLELARARVDALDLSLHEPLLLLLRHGDDRDGVRIRALLTDGPVSQRMSGVWTLQQIRSPLADELLLALCDDPDVGVASQAISAAVGRGGMERALEPLVLERLESGEDLGPFAHVAVQLGSPSAISALERIIAEGDPGRLGTAASALLTSPDPAIARRTLDLARDLEPASRDMVYASALYSSVDPRHLADEVLAHGEPTVRYVAVEALANAGTPDVADRLVDLSFEPDLRDSALYALARVGGPEAEARLVIAVEEPGVEVTAIGALQQLGTPSALETVTDLAMAAPAPEVRVAALRALHSRPGPGAEGAFRTALDDPDPATRLAGIEGLGTLRTPGALEELARALDSGPDEALAAARILQSAGGPALTEHQERVDALIASAGPPLWTDDFEIEAFDPMLMPHF